MGDDLRTLLTIALGIALTLFVIATLPRGPRERRGLDELSPREREAAEDRAADAIHSDRQRYERFEALGWAAARNFDLYADDPTAPREHDPRTIADLPEAWWWVFDPVAEAETIRSRDTELRTELDLEEAVEIAPVTAVAECRSCSEVIYRVGDDGFVHARLTWRAPSEGDEGPMLALTDDERSAAVIAVYHSRDVEGLGPELPVGPAGGESVPESADTKST